MDELFEDESRLYHLQHEKYRKAVCVPYIDKLIEDEVMTFMQLFDEVLQDTNLVAHVMLPSTPGAKSVKGKFVKNFLRPPRFPGRKERKRKVPVGEESKKKRASLVSHSQEDATNSPADPVEFYDLSNVTTLLSDCSLLDSTTTRLTRQSSRRLKNKTDNKPVSISKKISNKDNCTLTANLSTYPYNSTLMSSPPERPAPPSFSTLDSSLPKTPPPKPTPPFVPILTKLPPPTPVPLHNAPRSSLDSASTHDPHSPASSAHDIQSLIATTHISQSTDAVVDILVTQSSAIAINEPQNSVNETPPYKPAGITCMQDSNATELFQSVMNEPEPSISPIRQPSLIQQDSLDKSSISSRRSQSRSADDIALLAPDNPVTTLTDIEYEQHTIPPAIVSIHSPFGVILTPSILESLHAPTPSKTFPLEFADSDLCVTPPSDLPLKQIAKNSSRPFIESPLLEQYPDPSHFISKYDHLSQDVSTTPINPIPMLLGVTHNLPKSTLNPRDNSPSKFHQNCSPQSHTFLSPSTSIKNSPVSKKLGRGVPIKMNTSIKCKSPATKFFTSKQPTLDMPSISHKLRHNFNSTNRPVLLSPKPTNTSLQQIPRGLVSSITDKFQVFPGERHPMGKLVTVNTFFNKRPAAPAVNTCEENRVKVEKKQDDDEKRVIKQMNQRQNMLEKKKRENIKRQQIAAERRAEIERKHKELFSQKLQSKEDKRKMWERQSQRKKKAEEERRKREEGEKKRIELSQMNASILPPVDVNASTTFNTSSFLSSVPLNDVTSYYIGDLDSEDTDDEQRPRHQIPSWATEPFLSHKLRIQCTTSTPTDQIFPPYHLLKPIELTLVFEYNGYRKTRRPYNYRTSSAHWTSPMFKS